jgi:hypothetical protein
VVLGRFDVYFGRFDDYSSYTQRLFEFLTFIL